MAQRTKRRRSSGRKSNHYIDKKELFEETVKSLEKGQMSDRMARMLMNLTVHYSQSYRFGGYTYIEDMQAFAEMMLVRTWKGFDPLRSNQAFSFFTQCIKNSFKQFLNIEKRQRDIRDKMLVLQGLSPSHTYAEAYKEQQRVAVNRDFADDEEDYETTVKQRKNLDRSLSENEIEDVLEY
jgi:DNA-directed RNA polymerase specialized sigma subunit